MDSNTTADAYDEGLTVRREVMGAEYVDAALARTESTESAALQRHITQSVWGGIWTRPGLDGAPAACSTSPS